MLPMTNKQQVDWMGWKVKVVTEPTPFPAHLPVKRVSVNSFGYGGTNGHVIIEAVDSLLPNHNHGQPKANRQRNAHDQKRPFLLPFQLMTSQR